MKSNDNLKNLLSFLLRLGVSVGLLAWLFSRMDLKKMWETLRGADAGYMMAAAVIFIAINFMLLWRWNIFIKAMGLNVRTDSVTRWFFIGLFCNLFLPTAIGGDIIKAIGLCRETGQKAKVLASVVLDRLSGFASIVLVASVVFLFGYHLIQDPSILISIAALTALSLSIAAVLFNHALFEFICRIFNGWPTLKEGLLTIQKDISLLKNKKGQGFLAIGISSLNQLILAVMFYWVARALHTEINFVYLLIFSPLVCLMSSIPSIGGLGVREVSWVYLLSKAGVSPDIAVSMSLTSFIFMVAIGLFGGVLYVAQLSPGRIQHHQRNPGPRPKTT